MMLLKHLWIQEIYRKEKEENNGEEYTNNGRRSFYENDD